jgi:hypothetical protein
MFRAHYTSEYHDSNKVIFVYYTRLNLTNVVVTNVVVEGLVGLQGLVPGDDFKIGHLNLNLKDVHLLESKHLE